MTRFVALGVFDGVHLGHQAILREMVAQARSAGAVPTAITFEPHPDAVLRPTGAPPLLTTPAERERLIRALGVAAVDVLPFTPELARLPAREFVDRLLWPRFRPARVFVGYNFTFGHRGAGTPRLLAERGARLGFTVQTFPPVRVGGEVVSSTVIRRHIARGEVERAARALGRPHRLPGRVVRGQGRGRALGFPTANLEVPAGLCRPARGVYLVRVEGDGIAAPHPGLANLGCRPTFRREGERGGDTLEVYLLDFDGDLYGRELVVAFLARLRGELVFPSAEALARQIAADVAEARRLLAGGLPPCCESGAVQVK